MVTKDGHGDHNSEGGEENTVDATLDKLLKKVSDLSAKAIEGFSGPVVVSLGKIVRGVDMKIW